MTPLERQKISLVLCEQAIRAAERVRTVSRWRLLSRLFLPYQDETAFVVAGLVLISPGLLLWYFLDTPFIGSLVAGALGLVVCWGAVSYRKYDWITPSGESFERLNESIFDLQREFAEELAAWHVLHQELEFRSVDQVHAELEALRHRLAELISSRKATA